MESNLDLAAILNQMAGVTVLLVPIVMGLVEYAKKLGLDGKGNLILSMCLGVVFGAGHYLAAFGAPVGGLWFAFVLAALLPGMVASGVYDVLKK